MARGDEGEGIPFTPELRAELWQNAIRRWKAGGNRGLTSSRTMALRYDPPEVDSADASQYGSARVLTAGGINTPRQRSTGC